MRKKILKRLGGLSTVTMVALLTACGSETGAERASTNGAEAQVAAQPPAHPGKKIYEEFCFSCHAAGLNGAPKLGDEEAWAPRIAKGRDLLLATTIEGIPPAMPPRGICMSCSDEELADAIDYMIGTSQN